MNIKRNLKFFLESRKKNGKLIIENVPIRIRVNYAGYKVDFSTRYRIDIEKWDKKLNRVSKNCTNKLQQSASDINSDLDRFSTIIQTIFKEYEIQEIIPTPKQLKENFDNRLNRDSKDCTIHAFYNLFDDFVNECSTQNNWAETTKRRFTSVKSHLIAFDDNLTFRSLDESRLNDYVIFLRDKKNLRNVTIEKQVKCLKWFLRWATKKGHNKNLTFQTFKTKLKNIPKKVIFLTWEEINKLKAYKIPEEKQYLDRVRDVFLFQCYTGLRHSDVYNLKRSDIKDNYFEVTTVKTSDSLIIELNTYSRAVLDKYKDYHFKDNKVLPVISNQKMNDYLKELGELADINEPVRETYYKGNQRIDNVVPKYSLLTSHAGRRTFVCNSLAMGIPAETVMKWTGHSDHRTMKPYIDVADKDRQKAMQLWNKKEVQKPNNLLDELKQMPKENIISLFTQLLT
ncbi:MAG: tyrosine-type recombinase/integrase [Dysgonomonas sp.]